MRCHARIDPGLWAVIVWGFNPGGKKKRSYCEDASNNADDRDRTLKKGARVSGFRRLQITLVCHRIITTAKIHCQTDQRGVDTYVKQKNGYACQCILAAGTDVQLKVIFPH